MNLSLVPQTDVAPEPEPGHDHQRIVLSSAIAAATLPEGTPLRPTAIGPLPINVDSIDQLDEAITTLSGWCRDRDETIKVLTAELAEAHYAISYAAAREKLYRTEEEYGRCTDPWRTDRTLWLIARDAYRANLNREDPEGDIDVV
jgi:hypothetical protein